MLDSFESPQGSVLLLNLLKILIKCGWVKRVGLVLVGVGLVLVLIIGVLLALRLCRV
ncbi:hypothetical protein Hdeb2414_s0005g00161371 [Helianthus debilis subsp. tardiflorus]